MSWQRLSSAIAEPRVLAMVIGITALLLVSRCVSMPAAIGGVAGADTPMDSTSCLPLAMILPALPTGGRQRAGARARGGSRNGGPRTEARFLQDLVSQLGPSLEMERLLMLVLGRSLQLTGADSAAIALRDVASGELRTLASSIAAEEMATPQATSMVECYLRQATETNQPPLAPDVAQPVWWLGPSALVVPIRSGPSTLGAICVEREHPGRLSPRDGRSLSRLAELCAPCLESALLLEDTRTRARELEMLLNVSRIVASSLDLEGMLHRLAAELVACLGVTFCHLWLVDGDSRLGLRATARVSGSRTGEDQPRRELPPDSTAALMELLKAGPPLLVRKDSPPPLDHADLRLLAEGHVAESMLLVPLVARSRLLGVVVIGEQRRWERAPITPRKVALCQAMAFQAAMAIEREKMFSSKWEFLSIISHELRSPLSTISASAELLRRQPGGPRSDQLLEMIRTNSLRLGALVEDLLAVSRLDDGALHLRLEPLPLAPLLRRAVSAAQSTSTRHLLTLKVEAEIPLVMADPDKVETVLGNLLRNAINYSPDGGTVAVEARRVGDEVVVSVEDQGIGIPPDKIDRIFDRFFRLENGRAAARGHGLGLYIARGIVERHGGRIWVESRPGEGSRFSFTLPVHRREAAREGADRIAADGEKRIAGS